MLVITIVNKDIHHILKMRFPSEDLKLWLYDNGINVLTHWNSHGVLHSVLTIHIPFVIGAL